MPKFNSDEFIGWLQDKWGDRKCPLCGAQKWNVSDTVFELREFHQGDIIVGGAPIAPVIPVTCSNCGNTVLVNAILSKAIDPKRKEEE